ncbi:MAG: hypothetical protein OFPI_25620 [Osedax symbiont Rs2]|nr:MAG: hypothetical protein OFPI_25620 [Osedax symbiont Rs2]
MQLYFIAIRVTDDSFLNQIKADPVAENLKATEHFKNYCLKHRHLAIF